MFDIGWSEMAVIALIALIVIGPKDLPRLLRSVGHWTRKARGLAREFQSGVDDMIREADLEDAKKALDSAKSLNVDKVLEETVDPTGEVAEEVRSIEKAARDSDTQDPAATTAGQKPEAAGEATPESGDGAPPQATIIKHPLQVAPPHSIKPPPPADESEAGEDTSEKSA